eukprot:SAG11_NODE_13026_length_673_cov_1.811847_1_plen_30_part_10
MQVLTYKFLTVPVLLILLIVRLLSTRSVLS